MTVVWSLIALINTPRGPLRKSGMAQTWPLVHAAQCINSATAWTALWGLVTTYLPGALVMYAQLITRKPQLRLWGWFKVFADRTLGSTCSMLTTSPEMPL